MNSLWGIKGAARVAGGSGSLWKVTRDILAFFGILGLWVYVSAGSEGMVRGSRAVGVSWDMGMAQGLRVGVWEGSEMVYCTTAASHLKVALGSSLGFGGLEEAR